MASGWSDLRSLGLLPRHCLRYLDMRRQSSDSEVLAQIIDKLDNCPSGALAYALENGDEIIEPDLAKEVVVIRRLEIAA